MVTDTRYKCDAAYLSSNLNTMFMESKYDKFRPADEIAVSQMAHFGIELKMCVPTCFSVLNKI